MNLYCAHVCDFCSRPFQCGGALLLNPSMCGCFTSTVTEPTIYGLPATRQIWWCAPPCFKASLEDEADQAFMNQIYEAAYDRDD